MTKVCPQCGNESFIVYQTGIRKAIVDSAGKIKVVEGFAVSEQDAAMECTSCHQRSHKDGLVTEESFHTYATLYQ